MRETQVQPLDQENPLEKGMAIHSSILIYLFFFFKVLPLYCYQPISLHPHAHMLSHVTPWTAACQAPLSMDFSRQEYWSRLPFPSPTPVFLHGEFRGQRSLAGYSPWGRKQLDMT